MLDQTVPKDSFTEQFADECERRNFAFEGEFSYWPSIIFYLDRAGEAIHLLNDKWWRDLHTGKPIQRNVGEMLCLVHSEISEAMEGHRKSLMDDKLPHRPMIEVELADAMIRILDMAKGLKLDLAGAVFEKCKYNSVRADHTVAGRLAAGGKAY